MCVYLRTKFQVSSISPQNEPLKNPRQISLTVCTMSKMHEKLAFQKIRIKPTHIVIKSYT